MVDKEMEGASRRISRVAWSPVLGVGGSSLGFEKVTFYKEDKVFQATG